LVYGVGNIRVDDCSRHSDKKIVFQEHAQQVPPGNDATGFYIGAAIAV
jgi:hypothetical protein